MLYKSAPIREAIFDIRIDKLQNSSLKILEELHKLIEDDYPDKKTQYKNVVRFQIKEGKQKVHKEDSQVRGLIFSKKNNKRKVQIRFDGFTYNLLRPYSEWETFSKEALHLWKLYNTHLKPNQVTRVALRYINRIDIPIPINDFQDYIINMPPIPENLPKTYRNFFMQIDVPCNDTGTNIIVTETIEKIDNNLLPFILDIDVFKSGKISKSKLCDEFEKLRTIKNSTFENCITDETRKLIK